jgi:hypothetical protein
MNYQRIYDSIINRAKNQNRVKNKDTYYEAHHIIPSCLGGTGLTTQWKSHPNIVLLTGREHFLCHWLLHAMYPDNHKLTKAFFMMCTVKDNIQSRYTPSSRVIEYAKNRFIDAQRSMSQETKDKMSQSAKGNTKWLGKKHSNETKRKISDAHIGKTGYKHTEDFKQRLSELRKGENNPMYGGLSEEHKKNISQSQLGSKHPHSKITCPYCNTTGGRANMTRYHFINCKKKEVNN